MSSPVAAFFALALFLGGSSPTAVSNRDSYALVRGHSVSLDGSLDDLDALRQAYGANFLWVRRGGRRYVIRDERLLDEAAAGFARIEALDSEEAVLDKRQESLSQEEESLDRDQERLEAESEGDDAVHRAPADARWEDEQRDLARRRDDLEALQRDVEAAERDLQGHEEALEKEAEAALWRLIDRAIQDGAAVPVSR